MRIFVTGANGFLARHFICLALQSSHTVYAQSRKSFECDTLTIDDSLIPVTKSLVDIQEKDLRAVDVLVHLGFAGVSPQSISHEAMIQYNLLESGIFMHKAVSAGVERVVISGSSHEYGKSADDYDFIPPNATLEPLTKYGSVKAAAFHVHAGFAVSSNIKLVYPRIFNVFGPGQNSANFWPSLHSAAVNGLDFSMSTGLQICDFQHVAKISESLLHACIRDDAQRGVPLVYNVGSGLPISLKDFAKEQWSLHNAKGNLIVGAVPDRPGQPRRCVPNLSMTYNFGAYSNAR